MRLHVALLVDVLILVAGAYVGNGATEGAPQRLHSDTSKAILEVSRDIVGTRNHAGTGPVDPNEDLRTIDDVGGFPVIAPGTPCADTDIDGMSDEWEVLHGFNPNDAADGPQDADGDGYTNVEEYLNGTEPVDGGAVNHPPALEGIGDETMEEGERLILSVVASDPDGDALTVSARMAHGDPLSVIGATFTDHGDGTGTFAWTPGVDQAGEYLITFGVSDGELGASETITIMVLGVPQPPATPRHLVARAVSPTRIQLLWTDVADERRYELQRSRNKHFKNGVTTIRLLPDVTRYADRGLEPNKTYYYRLRACNATGCSAYSDTASAKTPKK